MKSFLQKSASNDVRNNKNNIKYRIVSVCLSHTDYNTLIRVKTSKISDGCLQTDKLIINKTSGPKISDYIILIDEISYSLDKVFLRNPNIQLRDNLHTLHKSTVDIP